MEGLMVHRGGQRVTKDELDLVPLPVQTDTYQVVSHYSLADKFLTMSQDILRDYVLVGQDYALARNGSQFFAVLSFKGEHKELGLMLALRNSYDKSLSVALAVGANAWVCDNLCIGGDIVVMKKHTQNVWQGLEDTAIAALYRSEKNYQKVIADSDRLKALHMTDTEAWHKMGELYGRDIISPRQITVLECVKNSV